MSGNVYAVTEIVGSSPVSVEDATKGAIAKASQSLDHLNWFEVIEMRGHIEDGAVAHYQVALKIGFRHV